MNEKQIDAYHEAAHAVAVICFKKKINCVSILSSGGGQARVHYKKEDNSIETLIIGLAGYVTELKICPQLEAHARKAAVIDFGIVEEHRGDHLIDQLLLKTRSFVENNWKAISTVAEELLERGCLFSKEIKNAITASDMNDTTAAHSSPPPK
jgi:hypothetical protein